jgi:hypothetical protein
MQTQARTRFSVQGYFLFSEPLLFTVFTAAPSDRPAIRSYYSIKVPKHRSCAAALHPPWTSECSPAGTLFPLAQRHVPFRRVNAQHSLAFAACPSAAVHNAAGTLRTSKV